MKKILMSVSIVAALSGCATTDGFMNTVGEKTGASQQTVGTVGGAAVGAVAGNVLGAVLGIDRGTMTLVGAAVGGWFGNKHGAEKDLEAAREAQQRMAMVGIEAKLDTQQVALKGKNEGDRPKQAEVVKRFAAPLPAAGMKSKDPQVAGVLQEVGLMANASIAPATIYVTAPDKKSAEFARAEVLKGVKDKQDVRVVATVAKESGVYFVPDYSGMLANADTTSTATKGANKS